jgi:outer membrane lipoprotein SlyB
MITVGSVVASLGAATAATPSYHVLFNGQYVPLSQPPMQRGGRVFVPMRAIFEKLGAGVAYDTGTINATAGNQTLQVRIGSNQAIVNGRQTFLDAAPFIIGSTTMVPLRFVSEALGATVEYDQNTGAINIATVKPTVPAGAVINGALGQDLSSKSATVGQLISAKVQAPVPDALLENATLVGKVMEASPASQGRNPKLEVTFTSIKLAGSATELPMSAKITKISITQKSNALNEAAGAAAGMVVGNIVGKWLGTNAGGAIGAVGGYALTSNAKQDLSVPAGSQVTLQLLQPLSLK